LYVVFVNAMFEAPPTTFAATMRSDLQVPSAARQTSRIVSPSVPTLMYAVSPSIVPSPSSVTLVTMRGFARSPSSVNEYSRLPEASQTRTPFWPSLWTPARTRT
jgi:hypothetical protein